MKTMGSALVVASALLVGSTLLSACMGDPVFEAELLARIESYPIVEQDAWEPAPAGCSHLDWAGWVLHRAEGESELGALLDGMGEVRCVDSMTLLMEQTIGTDPGLPIRTDPSPQPSTEASEYEGAEQSHHTDRGEGERPEPSERRDEKDDDGEDEEGEDDGNAVQLGSGQSLQDGVSLDEDASAETFERVLPVYVRRDPTPTPVSQPDSGPQ